jgi:glycosyltransferase involved in cell wall biosynthesis
MAMNLSGIALTLHGRSRQELFRLQPLRQVVGVWALTSGLARAGRSAQIAVAITSTPSLQRSDRLRHSSTTPTKRMKLAIVHDWLVTYAGSERCLEQMIECFPDADLFSTVEFVPENQRHFLRGKPVRTTFLQNMPGARRHFRRYLPLMPLAIEQLDLAGYDVIISSSHAVAKGVITGPDQLHLCYTYSPARYAWDLQRQYLRESGIERGLKSWLIKWALHRFRIWDTASAARVDKFSAISLYIARRVEKFYRRKASVIYPPVDVSSFGSYSDKGDFYVTASRMVPYKRIPLIVEAFARMPDRKLVVIGDGPDMGKCRAAATPNIHLLGYQPIAELRSNLQKGKAFVFAAEEDFGIAPLEAQACGTPVIAFGKGGATETIRGLDDDRPSGVFFREQTAEAIVQAVHQFEREKDRISTGNCRDNAMRFSIERFRREFKEFVETSWAQRRA